MISPILTSTYIKVSRGAKFHVTAGYFLNQLLISPVCGLFVLIDTEPEQAFELISTPLLSA